MSVSGRQAIKFCYIWGTDHGNAAGPSAHNWASNTSNAWPMQSVANLISLDDSSCHTAGSEAPQTLPLSAPAMPFLSPLQLP